MDVYAENTNQPARSFRGVTIDELYKVELVFRVNVTVYKLGEISAKLVHRSLGTHADTMFVNLYETHFSYIRDMTKFSHSYECSKCGESLWKYPSKLKMHELTCGGGIRRVYNTGGVYHTTPPVFQRLEDEGIHVVDVLRFYPYRATFDFECFFDGVDRTLKRVFECQAGMYTVVPATSGRFRFGAKVAPRGRWPLVAGNGNS